MSAFAWYSLGLITLPILTFVVLGGDWFLHNYHRGIGLAPYWVQALFLRRRIKRMTAERFTQFHSRAVQNEALLKQTRSLGPRGWALLKKEVDREMKRRGPTP